MASGNLLSSALSIDEVVNLAGQYLIVNCAYSACLKLENSTDSYNDRRAYAHEGDRGGDDQRYMWYAESMGEVYNIGNHSKSGGVLFSSAEKDSDGDFKIYGHADSREAIREKMNRVLFKIKPVYEGKFIYHIITTEDYFMKAGKSTDRWDDHQVYAGTRPDEGDERFHWVFVPADWQE